MSDQNDDPGGLRALNPYAWLTPEKYKLFAEGRGIPHHCELCRDGDDWWIDTGSEDGMIPRLSALPQTHEGHANTAVSLQMPVVRAVCINCGNVRMHAIFILEMWRSTYEKLGKPWGSRGLFDQPEKPGDE